MSVKSGVKGVSSSICLCIDADTINACDIHHFRLWRAQSPPNSYELWDTLEFIRYLWRAAPAYQITCWIYCQCVRLSTLLLRIQQTIQIRSLIADELWRCSRILHFSFQVSSMTSLRDPSMHVKPHRMLAHNKYLIGKSNTTFITDQFHIMSNLDGLELNWMPRR